MNKPTVVDLFAGAGGFGLGFEMAGFNKTLSVEIDAWACDTLRYNNPLSQVILADIRGYNSYQAIELACPTQPDIIIGGPPCQGFSIAGPARKDPQDPRNSLFTNFAQWVCVLEPRIFVLENVKGLLSRINTEGEKVIDIILQTFRGIGYQVEVWVLNAADYGVPQVRERVFIVGNHEGKVLGEPRRTHANGAAPGDQLSFGYQAEMIPHVTLWQAISDLPELKAGEGTEEQPYGTQPGNHFQVWARGRQQLLYNHAAMQHSARLVERFKQIAIGASSSDAPVEHGARRRSGNGELSGRKYDQNNRRLHPQHPSHTIAASFYANFVHPFQHRNLTAREGARIQSFPDYYRFMGKKTVVSHKLLQREERFAENFLCQYSQIGNAVPPLLAKAVAQHLKEKLTIC